MDCSTRRSIKVALVFLVLIFAGIALFGPNQYEPVNVPTGELAGAKAGDLYQLYLGTTTTVIPDTLNNVDFGRQLKQLWQKKLDSFDVTDNTEQTMQQLIDAYYNQRTFTSLSTYIKKIDHIANQTHASLQWGSFCKARKMSIRTCGLLKGIANTLSGRELLAYSLTELMPSVNGTLNVKILDLLLQNAGHEYIASLPAVHDSLNSFGNYQFTDLALLDTPGVVRGASIVGSFLPTETTIPKDVGLLRGDDHHKAAYLFAVRNLARMIHRLNDRQLDTFENGWKNCGDEIVQFIAVSHHGPWAAVSAAKRWIDNDMEYDFSVSVSKGYVEYAQKTKANYQAL